MMWNKNVRAGQPRDKGYDFDFCYIQAEVCKVYGNVVAKSISIIFFFKKKK